MADFQNRYPGYLKDLKRLMKKVGSLERIDQFKAHLKAASEGTSNAQKKRAAEALLSLFNSVSSLQGKIERFLGIATKLETVLNKLNTEDDGFLDQDENSTLEEAGRLEEEIFGLFEELKEIGENMGEYNAADGYSELHDNELVGDMYQAAWVIGGLSAEKKFLESKSIQMGLHDRVFKNGMRTNRCMNRFWEIGKKTNYMSLEGAKVNIEKAKVDISSLETEVKRLKSDATKEAYAEKYKKAEDDRQKYEAALSDLEKLKLLNDEAIKKEKTNLEKIKKLDEKEQEYTEMKDIFEGQIGDLTATYDKAKKIREKAKYELDVSKEALKDLSGDQKIIRAYYDKRMTYEKWKRAYEGFKDFMEKYKGEPNILGVTFFKNRESIEKALSTNEVQKKQIIEAKAELGKVLHWFPVKEVFSLTTSSKLVEHGNNILNEIKAAMDKAYEDYENDKSYQLTKVINNLSEQQNELAKFINSQTDKESEAFKQSATTAELIGKERDKNLEERNNKNLANTNEVDQIIEIQLDGEKKVAEAIRAEEEALAHRDYTASAIARYKENIKNVRKEAYLTYGLDMIDYNNKYWNDEMSEERFNELKKEKEEEIKDVPVKELITTYEGDIISREKQAEEFPDKKRALQDKLYTALANKRMYSETALLNEIKDTEKKLDNKKDELEKTNEIKKDLEGIYQEYRDISKDRDDIYKTYKDVEYSKDYYISVKGKAQSFLDGFDLAKKSKNYKNSEEYNAIFTSLSVLNGLKDDADIEAYRSAVIDVKIAASEYIRAKNAQFRLLPSKQRIYRINYAKSILKFCEAQSDYLTMDYPDAGKDAHEFMRKTEKLINEKKDYILTDVQFFSKYSTHAKKNKNIMENVDTQTYNQTVLNHVFEVEEDKKPKEEIDNNIFNNIYSLEKEYGQ